MSKFRRFAFVFILIEIVIFVIINAMGTAKKQGVQSKQYNVDISRVVSRMENGEALEGIDLDDYESIVAVTLFDKDAIYKCEYKVKSIGDELYCFQYQEDTGDTNNNKLVAFGLLLILANVILFIYIDRKVLSPFDKMDKLTTELAKGNLSTPIKQEKSKYFGKFLWGMDMLRETLEDNKRRELELLKEKKTLVLSLSHDIKTPLSAIDLYSKALSRDLYESDAERKAAYDGISNNVSEIKRYVDEISKASREEFLSLETNNTELYLSGLITKVGTYYAEKMKRLHTDFSVAPVDNCLVYGDEDRLIEVMQNCMENAIKYGDGKRIHISFDEEENCKLITIANTGCELNKDELTHVFDSFFRGSNSSRQDGTGLGLYICKELMHKMDGDIFAGIKDDEFRITMVVKKVI